MQSLDVEGYAALAFLVAVGRAGFGWAFAAVFLVACAFSFAANSALTFLAMAQGSTLQCWSAALSALPVCDCGWAEWRMTVSTSSYPISPSSALRT